jgi:hypothetical protein
MNKPTNLIELKAAIIILEVKQKSDALKLKEQCLLTYEQFKPLNLIKNTFHDLVKAPEFQGDLLDTSLSIATGYISKKMVIGNTHNPLKKALGLILQIAVTKIVSNHAEEIKQAVGQMWDKITAKNENVN